MACPWELACSQDGEDLRLETRGRELSCTPLSLPLPSILLPKQPTVHLRHSHAGLVRLSYPDWKADLDAALAVILPRTASQKHALNLRFLMEFLIPTVSSSLVTLISG